jgi:magnesium transporter
LLDTLTADYMPAIDALDTALDALESAVFNHLTPHTLSTIFAVKRAALHLRRIISPQREVLNKLARDDYDVIDPKDRVFFRDVYDHLVRLVDLNETLRDLTSGALDTYLSVTSNRINEVMKVLTVISALFMPISFVTGFFGMNFQGLPFDNHWLMAGAVGTVLVTPLLMLYWFTRRGWLMPSEPQHRRHSLVPEAADEEPQSQEYREEIASRKFHRRHPALGDGKGGRAAGNSAGEPSQQTGDHTHAAQH